MNPYLTAAFSVCVALLSAYVGSRLSSSLQVRQWQRDKLLIAFVETLELSNELAMLCDDVYHTSDPDGAGRTDEMFSTLARLQAIDKRMMFLLPDGMPALHSLVELFSSSMIPMASSADITDEEDWQRCGRNEYTLLAANFIFACQRLLGTDRKPDFFQRLIGS